ncbi:MAG: CRISPR-associated protein Cas4 [Eubacteriales bacterium]|nr:CRISPR-associated protein Cas4 [Eubacteriales bacterium]
MDKEYTAIRSLQHYLYCPHRWGLMEIDQAWKENYFVVKANLLHERVHDPGKYSAHNVKVFTDVSIWSDEYDIYGRLDCLEYKSGNYTIVEYKPTKPKNGLFRKDDLLQIYAQKKCVDVIFKTNCGTEIYYADEKRRHKIIFEEQEEDYELLLKSVLEEMHEWIDSGKIPPKRQNQKCGGCSMKDICMPGVFKKRRRSINTEIEAILKEPMI